VRGGGAPLHKPRASEITSFERISLAELKSPVVRQGVDHWTALRGARRFPARQDIHPRDIKAILANLLLIRVLDGGSDFEFRIAGDAQIQTYAIDFAGKRLSELKHTSPAYGYILAGLFGYVAQFGEPVALRGKFGPGFPNVRIAYCETAFMPLGSGDAVDHLLGCTAFVGNGS